VIRVRSSFGLVVNQKSVIGFVVTRERSDSGMVVNEREVSHWLSVDCERIKSLACWRIRESSVRGLRVVQRGVSQWVDCEQDRIMFYLFK
jgi:hypothetical protein